MFRLWGKAFKDTRLIKDMVVEDTDPDTTRTKKIFSAVEKICVAFDLSVPLWLDSNINDVRYHRKTRFTGDNFIDSLDMDYLEIEIIEE